MSLRPNPPAHEHTEVADSSVEHLVPKLYEHLLVHLERGARHIRDGDREGRRTRLSKASDIIAELLVAVDLDAGGELADRLSALYGNWLREISIAGRDVDARRVERVAEMVGSLLDAWTEAAKLVDSAEAGDIGSEAS